MLNYSGFQKQIITYYLDHYFDFNDIEVSITHFDYNIFSSQISSDLHILEYQDTILFTPNFKIDMNFFDFITSNELHIEHIYLDSLLLNIPKRETDSSYEFKRFFTFLSSFDQKILLSNLQLNNIHVLYNGSLINTLDMKMTDLSCSNHTLNIQNIFVSQDSCSVNGTCSIRNNNLILDITNSDCSNFLSLLPSYNIFNNIDMQFLNFSSNTSFSKDSIVGFAEVVLDSSRLAIDFVKKPTLLYAQYQTKLNSLHLPILGNNQNLLKDIIVNGFLEVENKIFSSNGEIDCNYGDLHFSLDMFNTKNINIVTSLIDFELGDFLNKKRLGQINSTHFLAIKDNSILNLDTEIHELVFDDYSYQNIFIQQNSLFNNRRVYDISLNDPNCILTAQFNLQSNPYDTSMIYHSSIVGLIKYIDLNALNYNISENINFLSSEFEFNNFRFLFSDNQISFLETNNPSIMLNNFQYNKQGNVNLIDSIYFYLNSSQLSINSSFGNIRGEVFSNTIFDLNKNNKLPSFSLNGDLNRASVLSDIFSNNVDLNDTLAFSIYSENSSFPTINCMSPNIKFSDIILKNCQFNTMLDTLKKINLLVDNVIVLDKIQLNNFNLSTEFSEQNISNFLLTYSSLNLNEGKLAGGFEFIDENSIDIHFADKSVFQLFNYTWSIDPLSKLVWDRGNLRFKNFSLIMDGQVLGMNGWLGNTSNMTFSFNKFKINYLNPFLRNRSFVFDGVLDGNVVFNPSSFPALSGNFEVNDFAFNNTLLGRLKLNNISNEKNDSIYTTGMIQDTKETMRFIAKYPLDGTKDINANIIFNEFPIEVLDLLIKPVSDLSGRVNGNLNLDGLITNYNISGTTSLQNVNFKIPYLGMRYSAKNNDLAVKFNNNLISMDNFTFYDISDNTRAVFNAEITHTGLKDMFYNLSIDTDSLHALNTSKYDNSYYYGNIFLGGNMLINGAPKGVSLIINGKSKGGSKLMIPLSRSKEVEKNQFIRFNTHVTEDNMPSDQVVQKPNFDMDFNLSIDNQSEIQLIIDEELGDIIKGYGEGDLSLKLNKEGDFEVFGDFEIEKGNYLFTLQDVITKSFEIEKGGILEFDGSVYDARINLSLLYNTQASLNPLNPDYDRDTKSPIICRMEMSGSLLDPDINFSIDIVNGDQIAEAYLESLTNTDQKLLEQFLYLLIANSFLIENDPTVDYIGNTLATTGTELLSNQLSNWLSQTTDAFDLGFKWIPGTNDSLSSQQVELAVSYKFLDNRFIVNGNVGTPGTRTPSDQSKSNIVGDLDIEFDYFRDGKFKFRFFTRPEDYDPLSITPFDSGYETGIGMFFKKQFNTFNELFIIEKNE